MPRHPPSLYTGTHPPLRELVLHHLPFSGWRLPLCYLSPASLACSQLDHWGSQGYMINCFQVFVRLLRERCYISLSLLCGHQCARQNLFWVLVMLRMRRHISRQQFYVLFTEHCHIIYYGVEQNLHRLKLGIAGLKGWDRLRLDHKGKWSGPSHQERKQKVWAI